MKKKWLKSRAVITLCAALGWWGLLYPELTLTPDTVIVWETDCNHEQAAYSEMSFTDRDLYRALLSAKRENVTYRSKLWEDLSLIWEAFQNGIK